MLLPAGEPITKAHTPLVKTVLTWRAAADSTLQSGHVAMKAAFEPLYPEIQSHTCGQSVVLDLKAFDQKKRLLRFKRRVAATVFKNSNFVFLFCALQPVVYVRKFETKPELKGENCCLLSFFLWKPECTMLWVNWMLMWILMGRNFAHCYYVISTLCVCRQCGLVS